MVLVVAGSSSRSQKSCGPFQVSVWGEGFGPQTGGDGPSRVQLESSDYSTCPFINIYVILGQRKSVVLLFLQCLFRITDRIGSPPKTLSGRSPASSKLNPTAQNGNNAILPRREPSFAQQLFINDQAS